MTQKQIELETLRIRENYAAQRIELVNKMQANKSKILDLLQDIDRLKKMNGEIQLRILELKSQMRNDLIPLYQEAAEAEQYIQHFDPA